MSPVYDDNGLPNNQTWAETIVTEFNTLTGQVNRDDFFTDGTSFTREPRNGTFTYHPVKILEVKDATAFDSLHLDVRLKNVGDMNHDVDFTGFSKNDTWTLNRTIDFDHLSFTVVFNETGFRYLFLGKSEQDGSNRMRYADFYCAFDQVICTDSIEIGAWDLTYEYVNQNQTIDITYSTSLA